MEVCCTKNEDILRDDPVQKKSEQYKKTPLNHANRTEDIRYTKQVLDYRSIGRRLGNKDH
jgi:hypothetical protein